MKANLLRRRFQSLLGAAATPAAATDGGRAKLIKPDGHVYFLEPISASELLTWHPGHLLCRSDAFTVGQKIPAMAGDELLLPGHVYFLLPVHVFQSVLSFSAIARQLIVLHGKFDVHRTSSGQLQIRVSDDAPAGRVCTTPALEKDYRRLVNADKAKLWKPKLETIKETPTGRTRMVSGAIELVDKVRGRLIIHQSPLR
ncbi:uncharacterized protein LOC144704803 [Wolffia australiana]